MQIIIYCSISYHAGFVNIVRILYVLYCFSTLTAGAHANSVYGMLTVLLYSPWIFHIITGRRSHCILRLPEDLFLRMAGTVHRAVLTSASTGGSSFFLVFGDIDENRRNDCNQYSAYQNRGNIFKDPCNHSCFLLFRIKVIL